MRSYLTTGTLIKVSGGIIYKISGEPIGEGGGSIIYPAFRMLPDGNGYKTSHIAYAIKECYPQSEKFEFFRNSTGEICSVHDDHDAADYLSNAKKMQMREESISGIAYLHAFRLTPVIEAYQEIDISTDNGATFTPARNMISVMESLAGKGTSLRHFLADKKHMQARETFDVIRQVLFAVAEVHKSGFLHLDIQDGNVFLKGVLDKNDHMISLIDFCSARAMLPDGMCSEITDKVLYSTQGFTAPEIIKKNDGHLRLGKQADIYSIGALALLLLTGHRYTTAELIANKTGKYIPRFSVRKTGCPAHLTEKMQSIIAKALCEEPSMRYGSCDEMLRDVDEMLSLLAPHADPISAVDYDAFICYKHGEKDNIAAITLRDSLERYKDSFLSKAKINRVFLDEGEFSSCSDFGDRINAVLKNSKWLIVLCSKQTRQSVWVNEEIRAFLKHHDKSHILAVIIEGEPDMVYPDELVKNGLTANTLFAADARAESDADMLKRIKGNVCLQIAAPILETTFDSLKQRQRTYKLQRCFAVTAVIMCTLLGFISYAAVKNHQLSEQAEAIVDEQNAKIASQSELLARQSREAFNTSDYSKAMQLALSSIALSDANEVQLSQLKSILISCLNLYIGPEESSMLASPSGLINEETADEFNTFFTTADGSHLIVVSDYRVSVWDTKTCKLVSAYDNSQGILADAYYEWEDYLIEDKEQFIICAQDELFPYSYETGKKAWSRPISSGSYKTKKILLSGDHKHLYQVSYSFQDEKALIEDIDPDSGKLLMKHFIDGDFSNAFNGHCVISKDNRYIASLGVESHDSSSMYMLLTVFDIATDSSRQTRLYQIDPWGTMLANHISLSGESSIIVSKYDGPVNVNSRLDGRHEASYIGSKMFQISCYDIESLDLIWTQESNLSDRDTQTSSLDVRDFTIPIVVYTKVGGRNAIFACFSSTLWMLDRDTGTLIKEWQLDSDTLALEHINDQCRLVMSNGDLVFINDDADHVSKVKCFPDSFDMADSNGDCFYIQSPADHRIVIKYELGKYDAGYSEEFVPGQTASEYVSNLEHYNGILEQDGHRLEISDDRNSFTISSSEKAVNIDADEDIRALSFVPGQDRIIVGYSDQICIYDLEGTTLCSTRLPHNIYSIDDVYLFFPEPGVCCYGNLYGGYLADINENSIDIFTYILNVVGFDSETTEIIICDQYKDDGKGCTVGRIKYHTLDEVLELASKAVS